MLICLSFLYSVTPKKESLLKYCWEKEFILWTLHDFLCAHDGIFHISLCLTGLQCSDWSVHTTEQSKMIFFMSFILLLHSRKMLVPSTPVFCAWPFFTQVSTSLSGKPWLSSDSLCCIYASDFLRCHSLYFSLFKLFLLILDNFLIYQIQFEF